jgi:hypothetical protein
MVVPNRPLHLFLGGLSVVLMVVVAAEFDLAVSDVEASPGPAPGGSVAIVEPPAAPDFDALAEEILQRPVFSPDRKPPAEAPVEAEPVEVKAPPELKSRLAGVIIGPDDKEAFFARDAETSKSVKEGDEIDGWTVTSIEPDRVTLKSDFGEKTVEPTFGEAGAAARLPQKILRKPPSVPKGVPTPRPNVAALVKGSRPGGPAIQTPQPPDSKPRDRGGR